MWLNLHQLFPHCNLHFDDLFPQVLKNSDALLEKRVSFPNTLRLFETWYLNLIFENSVHFKKIKFVF